VLLANAPFLVQAEKPEDAFLVFSGRVSLEDKTRVYEVRILRSKGGEIAYGKGKGEAGLTEIVQGMVKGLPQRLAELEGAVFSKNAALMALPKAMERARKGQPLRLVKAEAWLEPAQAAQYGASPLATLWLEVGKPLTGVVARAKVEGLSSADKENPPVDLKGASAKLPVLVALDSSRVEKAAAPAIAPLAVRLAYKQGDIQRETTVMVPVRVGPK